MTDDSRPDATSIERFKAEFGMTQTHGIDILRLLHMLANRYETVLSAYARGQFAQELSGSRWRLLLYIYFAERTNDSGISPTELSRVHHVTKNTISSLLRSLEEQGLIERSLDPDDRRQFRIRLSETGRDLVRTATPGYIHYVNDLTTNLTSAEITELIRLLWRLHGSLVQHCQLPEAYLSFPQEPPLGDPSQSP